MPGISATVAPLQMVLKPVNPANFLDPASVLELVRNPISLGVHIRSDVMRHFSGRMA